MVPGSPGAAFASDHCRPFRPPTRVRQVELVHGRQDALQALAPKQPLELQADAVDQDVWLRGQRRLRGCKQRVGGQCLPEWVGLTMQGWVWADAGGGRHAAGADCKEGCRMRADGQAGGRWIEQKGMPARGSRRGRRVATHRESQQQGGALTLQHLPRVVHLALQLHQLVHQGNHLAGGLRTTGGGCGGEGGARRWM